jgi:putative transposase
LGSATKRELTTAIVEEHKISVSRACKITQLPRSQYYYKSVKDDAPVIELLQELAFKHSSCGFPKLFDYIRRSGKPWNHKRVRRIYKLLKLHKRRKGKRRVPARVKQPLIEQEKINSVWSMDFMSDSMVGNRKFRTFNVIDDCTREALAIEIDTSLSGKRITRVLDRIIEHKGKPGVIRADNGPEFTSKELVLWANARNVLIQYIQPGRPMQNGYIERFNRSYREAVLDAYLFIDLDEVRELTTEWLDEYNNRRPHESLKKMTPSEWRTMIEMQEITTE